ncbi:MAG: hypothetical protein ABIS28_08305 [Caldimonas sp.]
MDIRSLQVVYASLRKRIDRAMQPSQVHRPPMPQNRGEPDRGIFGALVQGRGR